VLIADDDPDIRALVRELLSRAGFETVDAQDGTEALALARRSQPDLVLLDVTMPGLDGYAVCESIFAERHDPPPVIFLTARSETSDQVRGFDAGGVDYIVKPFRGAELVARVRAALRTKRRIDELVETVGVDSLTGVGTRAALDERLEQAFAQARRDDQPLSCVIVDIDHFKEVNDRYGHLAGDAVLREVGDRLRLSVRRSDEVFRYGGEEFVILMSAVGEEAYFAASRLLDTIAARAVALPAACGHASVRIRASAGIAGADRAHESGAALLAAADHALYAAKRAGRDQLVVAG
jgi:diguanylate cyclase (GGDEF)-like protein